MLIVIVFCGVVFNCYKSNVFVCMIRINGGNSVVIYKLLVNSINFYFFYCVIIINFFLINKLIV